MGKHRGPWDKGDQFDSQHGYSEQRANAKRRNNQYPYDTPKTPEITPAKSDSCLDKSVILLALLGGLAWAFSEIVSRVT